MGDLWLDPYLHAHMSALLHDLELLGSVDDSMMLLHPAVLFELVLAPADGSIMLLWFWGSTQKLRFFETQWYPTIKKLGDLVKESKTRDGKDQLLLGDTDEPVSASAAQTPCAWHRSDSRISSGSRSRGPPGAGPHPGRQQLRSATDEPARPQQCRGSALNQSSAEDNFKGVDQAPPVATTVQILSNTLQSPPWPGCGACSRHAKLKSSAVATAAPQSSGPL